MSFRSLQEIISACESIINCSYHLFQITIKNLRDRLGPISTTLPWDLEAPWGSGSERVSVVVPAFPWRTRKPQTLLIILDTSNQPDTRSNGRKLHFTFESPYTPASERG